MFYIQLVILLSMSALFPVHSPFWYQSGVSYFKKVIFWFLGTWLEILDLIECSMNTSSSRAPLQILSFLEIPDVLPGYELINLVGYGSLDFLSNFELSYDQGVVWDVSQIWF